MDHPTAAAAFFVLFVAVTLWCMCRSAARPAPEKRPAGTKVLAIEQYDPLLDGPCPARYASKFRECWYCWHQTPHPSPARCAVCGKPPDERYHHGITGTCLGDYQ